MKPILLIAGAGETGIALARQTVTQWKPVLLELNSEQIALVDDIPGVTAILGDATSTLVLKRAKLEGVAYAVATTGDDEVNLAFCS